MSPIPATPVVPPPDAELDELERLARNAAIPRDADSPTFVVSMRIDRPNDDAACAAFNRWKDLALYCTPERIARLVDAVRRGAEDSARLVGLLDALDEIGHTPSYSIQREDAFYDILDRVRKVRAAAAPEERDDATAQQEG